MRMVIDTEIIKDRIENEWGYEGIRDDLDEIFEKHGTPFPKGHGRLIDADEAIKVLKSLGNRDYRREKGTIQEAIKMLSYEEYTPTIIEADRETEN